MEVLLDRTEYLTLDNIAQSAGVSKRSVQNHLDNIDDWILKNGLIHTLLIRKRGQGVMINSDAMDRLKIQRLLSSKSFSVDADDNKRRLDIIKKLLILEEETTIKSLSEQFYISRGTATSDMEWVKEWLLSYKIELFITQRKGIVTRGTEISYRNAIAGYFDSYKSAETGETIVINKHGRLQENSYKSLTKIYPKDNVDKVKRIIESAEKNFGFFLSEDYYTSLLTHIVICISRLISGNTVPPEFNPPEDEEFPGFVIETTEHIVKRLETTFNIKLPEMEKTYICIHLVGFNALSTEHSSTSEIPKEVRQLALELIKSVDTTIGTNFVSDKILFFGLCLHLKSQVFRLQRDIYFRKASNFQLSENNIDLYQAIAGSSDLYNDICRVRPDEEEILNATCYFLLSLRRSSRHPKALLISNSAIIERMELLEYIEKSLPSVDIVDCCTTYQLKFQTVDEYDFFISMETIDSASEAAEISKKLVIDLSTVDSDHYTEVILDHVSKT